MKAHRILSPIVIILGLTIICTHVVLFKRAEVETSKNLDQDVGEPIVDASRKPGLAVDIISIGSHTRSSFQEVQQKTFGSHPIVRNFFQMTEDDDTESDCNQKVTLKEVRKVTQFCRSRGKVLSDGFESLKKMTMHYARFAWLQKKSNPVGWLCAQKRPVDGISKVLKQYETKNQELPDYLMISDDDTWFNLNKMEHSLPKMYPVDIPFVVAGCMIRSRVYEHDFTIPFGGWGIILNKAALANFIRPIHCQSNNDTKEDEFVRLACWRVSRNQVGERPFFREGISVAQLMDAYVNSQPFQKVFQWAQTGAGYCMHSDWAWGYFVNFYHLAIQGTERPELLEERLVGYNSSYIYAGKPTPENKALLRECLNKGNEGCTKDSTICHYVTEEHMRTLHKAIG